MLELRITYTDKEELNKILDTLKSKHTILSVSKPYRNFRSKNNGEYRVYTKVEIKKTTERI